MVALGEILIVALIVAAAVGIHAVIQRRSDYHRLQDHNDVAGFLLSVVGVTYAVLLGFVVVLVWQRYAAAQDYVQQESAAVADAYRVAAGFPQPLRGAVRADLREYVQSVVRREWPAMRRGIVIGSSSSLERAAYDVDTFRPGNAGEVNVQQSAMRELHAVFDARRRRFAQVAPSVPPILWIALVAGGIVTLFFTYLLGTANRAAQLAMTAAVAGIVAVLFVVIGEFDTPYSGAVAVQPSNWAIVSQQLPTLR
ncbi:MAG TPA: DUF4239 domain-containing protein [Candidatus Dormibacteraeota bacterium]|nr:DUF4239 domain-containing protein [Candidatus Dormibacteraeota bacterium]